MPIELFYPDMNASPIKKTVVPQENQAGAIARASTGGLAQIWMARICFRLGVAIHLLVLSLLQAWRRWIKPTTKREADGVTILLTGTFYSDNWLMNKIRPLVGCERTKAIYIVCTREIVPMEKVHHLAPPRWLCKTLGDTPARLLMFGLVAVRIRPNVIGGYHLLANGLAAQMLALLVGAKSVYLSCAGPNEVIGGGYRTGSWFRLLRRPDPVLERQLLAAVRRFDCIVAKGPKTAHFFRQFGVKTLISLIPGGIDASPLQYRGESKLFDIMILARLYSVKRIDIFIRTVEALRNSGFCVQAAIVGSGEDENDLRKLTEELGLAEAIKFAGHQDDIGWWLKRARVFVLTSESEGLAMSLVEAMMAGLPAVVPDVGELGMLVADGVNGYLVGDLAPESFAAKIANLLTDDVTWARFSAAASRAAREMDLHSTSREWEAIFRHLGLLADPQAPTTMVRQSAAAVQ